MGAFVYSMSAKYLVRAPGLVYVCLNVVSIALVLASLFYTVGIFKLDNDAFIFIVSIFVYVVGGLSITSAYSQVNAKIDSDLERNKGTAAMNLFFFSAVISVMLVQYVGLEPFYHAFLPQNSTSFCGF